MNFDHLTEEQKKILAEMYPLFPRVQETTRLHPEDMAMLADLIADRIAGQKAKPEPLLNLKELSEVINVPYGTLAKKKLPCHKMGRHARKMYRASEVIGALK